MNRKRIDKESLAALDTLLEQIPGGFNAIADISRRRDALKSFLREAQASLPPNENVLTDDVAIARSTGEGELKLRVYRPTGNRAILNAVYYIHGGGMLMGGIDDDDPLCNMLCETLGVVVVAVEYRLAPEDPYPAGLDDCVAGLRWLGANASALGANPDGIALYGGSAGGNLAIASALLLRDHGGPRLCGIVAPYPMLDDRNETRSSHEINDVGIWDRDANLEAWNYYLAGGVADGYAAPARMADLSGLAPTFMDVGEVDLFRDECLTFAARLLQAGVATELHVYPGAYHGCEIFAPGTGLGGRIWARRIEALQRAFN